MGSISAIYLLPFLPLFYRKFPDCFMQRVPICLSTLNITPLFSRALWLLIRMCWYQNNSYITLKYSFFYVVNKSLFTTTWFALYPKDATAPIFTCGTQVYMWIQNKCVNNLLCRKHGKWRPVQICNLSSFVLISSVRCVDMLINHAHLSGRGRKIDFGSQREFQLDMRFWGKSYQKIHDLKKSTGGPNF